MTTFAIIEIDDGFKVLEILAGQSPESAAAAEGGQLVDPGPYHRYEDALEALDKLQVFDENE
jgi:hypothetical protein